MIWQMLLDLAKAGVQRVWLTDEAFDYAKLELQRRYHQPFQEEATWIMVRNMRVGRKLDRL